MTRNRWQVAFIVVLCVLGGCCFGLIGIGIDLEDMGLPNIEPQTDRAYAGFVCLSFIAGMVSWGLLPWAISHDPRELEKSDFPGTRKTFVCGVVVIACGFSYFAVLSQLVAMVSMTSRRSVKWSVAAVVASLSYLAVYPLNPASEFEGWLEFGIVPVLVIVLLIGMQRGKNREKQQNLQREIREEIARDMHDSLSHRLSLIAVHAGALSFQNEQVPKEYSAAAETIRQEANAAVQDLRAVLYALRQEAAEDPRASIETLIRDDNVKLLYSTDPGIVERLDTLGQHTLYRAVQEAATNARKYARGKPVLFDVAKRGPNLVLTVSNPHTGPVGRGFGLRGLAERAELIGGKLRMLEGDEFGWELQLPTKR